MRRGNRAKHKRRERSFECCICERHQLGIVLYQPESRRSVLAISQLQHLVTKLARNTVGGIGVETKIETGAGADFQDAAIWREPRDRVRTPACQEPTLERTHERIVEFRISDCEIRIWNCGFRISNFGMR